MSFFDINWNLFSCQFLWQVWYFCILMRTSYELNFIRQYFAVCYVWYLKSLSIKINDLNFSKTQMTILRQYFAYLEANKITRTKCYLMCVNDYLYRLKCFVCIIIRREVLCYCCCYSNIYLPFVTKFVCFRDFQNNLI